MFIDTFFLYKEIKLFFNNLANYETKYILSSYLS